MKPSYDSKITSYIDSLTANTITGRLKFINLPQSFPGDITKFITTLVETQGPLVKEAVDNIFEHSNSVPDSPRLAGFVLDMFLTPFVDVANEFGVPSYVEFVELKDSETEFIIPAYINPVPTKSFPPIMFRPETATFIFNMVTGLREMRGSSEAHPNYDTIMQWLDEQPCSSVVFLCFGSMGGFNVEQVIEIANALEQRGHRFLWSLRRPGEQAKGMRGSPTDYENVREVLPEGFLDRTAGIGKVIGWAPQVDILSHPATGGFVSHCSWNSTLESIWFGLWSANGSMASVR
ncbi:hypothetical protein V6N13_112532 [Hibiscus sabdariffa]